MIPLWGVEADQEVFGERLRDARVIQRLKSSGVAEKAHLTPDRYSRLENSLSTKVNQKRIAALADAVDFPIDFLTSPPVTPVQRGSLLFRAKKGMTRGEEDQLVAWARLIGDLLHRAEEDVRLPYVKVPRVSPSTSPADAARISRSAFGLADDEPIPHLVRLLERSGVHVASVDFSAELHAKYHDAFSTWVGYAMDRPLVVTRSSSSWERTRLSVAHELGHLVMHQTRREGDLEAEAYTFASEFLLPRGALQEGWPRQVTLVSLMPLKRKWGMSLASLIEHGYRNGLVESTQRTNLYKQMSNRRDRETGERWRVREPGWNDRDPERPKLIAKVAEAAFGPNVTTQGISAEIYGWRSDLIGKLLEGQLTDWSRAVTATHINERMGSVSRLRL
ncbi:helix-turn-helix domain-containing protein [Parafrankia sp. FMc2]|uniref:helix-turn-helix domain-containing protein n=1 Tax=Parafrankia sp. FMc2 TaxID=3233196 RepID=UPI0034D4A33C